MAKNVQQPGLTTAAMASTVGLDRQILINTDDHSIVVHDGATPGGIPTLSKASGDAAYLKLGFDNPAIPASLGFVARTGAGGGSGAYALRSLTIDSSALNISGGDGSVNPTIALNNIITGDRRFTGVVQVDGGINANTSGTHYGAVSGAVSGSLSGTVSAGGGAAVLDSSGRFFSDRIQTLSPALLNPLNSKWTCENNLGSALAVGYNGSGSGINALSVSVNGIGPVLQGFFYGAGNVGNITTNGSSTSYGTTSDYRRKKNVDSIDTKAAVNWVKGLRPVFFNWSHEEDDAPKTPGFIAHELQQRARFAVSGEKDAVYPGGELFIPQNTIIAEGVPEPGVLPQGTEWIETHDSDEQIPSPLGTVVYVKEIVASRNIPEPKELPPEMKWRYTGDVPVWQNVDATHLIPGLTAALLGVIARLEAVEALHKDDGK